MSPYMPPAADPSTTPASGAGFATFEAIHFGERKTFDEARAECQAKGLTGVYTSDLASIRNADEQAEAVSLI